MPSETTTLHGEARARVRLNGERNTLLSFQATPRDEPYMWGFATLGEWRDFLKMCLRYDDALGRRNGNDD